MSDGDNVRTWPIPEAPVIYLRQPGDRVTLIFQPELLPESPREFGELVLPAKIRLAVETPVYAAPGGAVVRQAPAGTVIDVYAEKDGYWLVTQAPLRLWLRAALLVRTDV